jgi:hypothetical protein
LSRAGLRNVTKFWPAGAARWNDRSIGCEGKREEGRGNSENLWINLL